MYMERWDGPNGPRKPCRRSRSSFRTAGSRSFLPDAAFLVLEALADQGQEAKGAAVGDPGGRRAHGPAVAVLLAALLSLDTDPAAAGSGLPAVAESNLNASLMLFYTACKSSDATVRDGALARLAEIFKDARLKSAGRTIGS